MSDNKIKLEIYEGDPFEGSCCSPARLSGQSVDELRRMLTERNETVKRLGQRFHETVEVKRDIISNRRGLLTYPAHVRQVLTEKGWDSLPYIFLDGQLICFGNFPSYDGFVALVSPYLKKFEGHKK